MGREDPCNAENLETCEWPYLQAQRGADGRACPPNGTVSTDEHKVLLGIRREKPFVSNAEKGANNAHFDGCLDLYLTSITAQLAPGGRSSAGVNAQAAPVPLSKNGGW